MQQELTIQITNEISRRIAQDAPYVEYSQEDLRLAKQLLPDWEKPLAEDDFECFYVIREFCRSIGIWKIEYLEYLNVLMAQAKLLSWSEFYSNPYIEEIQVPEVRRNQFFLTHASYAAGEIFQYDMPDMTEDVIVPKLGFFHKKVSFPGIYEGIIPWVSVCPSEMNSMQREVKMAYGRTLVLGLGLGYYPFMISKNPEVTSITIIERQPEVIELFEAYLLPQFSEKHKIKIIHADAYDYLDTVETGEYDFCFADIWESQIDGADAYVRIKQVERRLPGTEFAYWIEDSIRWWLNGC
jgi:hypothetical protein